MADLKHVFDESYQRLMGRGVAISEQGSCFFNCFYKKFTAASPEVNEKFASTDFTRQVKMLRRSMFHMVALYETRSENWYLLEIAESHSKRDYDIKPALFDLWLEALIETVREMDPEFCDDVELAWRVAMTPGITLMKHYHDRPTC